MARLLVCGGLLIEAASSLLSWPGVSESSLGSASLVSGLIVVLPGAYKLLTGPFMIVFHDPVSPAA